MGVASNNLRLIRLCSALIKIIANRNTDIRSRFYQTISAFSQSGQVVKQKI